MFYFTYIKNGSLYICLLNIIYLNCVLVVAASEEWKVFKVILFFLE